MRGSARWLLLAVMAMATMGALAQTNLPVYRAVHPPAIDGVLDPIWHNVPWNRDYRLQAGGDKIDDWNDGAESFRILYDEHYLYMFIQVNDDTLVNDTGSSATYQDDSIELWLDGDNSKGAAYDGVNDLGIKFVVNPADSINWFLAAAKNGGPAGLDLSGVMQAAVRTPLGLNLEIAVPMDQLQINTAAGSLFGIELDYNDDDDGGVRDTKIKYFSDQDESWRYPNTLGTAEIGARVVGEILDVWYTETAPVIDGTVDAVWASIPQVNDNHILMDAGPAPTMISNWQDLSMTVKMTWDTTNLYFLVDVKDESLNRRATGAQPRGDWHDDALEIWMDGDNSKAPGYDGVNDRGFNIVYENPVMVMDTAFHSNGTPTYYMGGFSQGSALTADGFVLEMAFPLDSLGIQPLNHWRFGLDVDYDDNDDGLTRNHKAKVYATIDGAWNQPVLWGTAELLGGPVEDAPEKAVALVPLVKNTLTAPTIDGESDSSWVNVLPTPLGNSLEEAPANWLDAYATFRMSWDKTNLYLLVNVYDDVVNVANADASQNDGLVLYMDGDNKKTATYDGKNDDAILFVYGQAPVNMLPDLAKKVDVAKFTYAWKETALGYNLEVAMPWTKCLLITKPSADKLAGFDLQLNDNDTGVRNSMLKFASATGATPEMPAEFGAVRLTTRTVSSILDIPYTAYPIFIDAEPDFAWNEASNVMANFYLPDDAGVFKRFGPADVTLGWRAMWNMDNLYFWVHAKDDTLIRDSTDGYKDDGIELWFDGDNSRKTTYDGVNDHGFSFRYNPANPGGLDETGHWNNGKMVTVDMTQVKTASKIVEDGIILEAAFPLDLLGVVPGNGSAIGIEFDYNDDDDGGERDTKVKTYSRIDDSWTNPSVLGWAQLVGSNIQSAIDTEPVVAIRAFDLSQNYPNPFNPLTKINYTIPNAGPVTLSVYNMLGQRVELLVDEQKAAGTYTVNFDASRYTSGLYIYRLETGGRVLAKKLMLVK